MLNQGFNGVSIQCTKVLKILHLFNSGENSTYFTAGDHKSENNFFLSYCYDLHKK